MGLASDLDVQKGIMLMKLPALILETANVSTLPNYDIIGSYSDLPVSGVIPCSRYCLSTSIAHAYAEAFHAALHSIRKAWG